MTSEFDIQFDYICDDVFPKLAEFIAESTIEPESVTQEVVKYLTFEEGYDSDMATAIWESYQLQNELKHR